MRILVSNDDGYLSEGIRCLANALKSIAEVVIVAPERNRSGASNSLTIDRPLNVTQTEENVYFVNGTPTDCVHLASTILFKQPPDMVVSGINHGQNLGDDVLYSGTVAAAMEGRNLGFPALAISLHGQQVHFETAAHVAKLLVLRLQAHPLPARTILNVNVPDLPIAKLGPYEITRLGTRHASQTAVKQMDPRGREIYWIGEAGEAKDASHGTDFYAVQSGNISVTPLQLDLTNYSAFEHLASWTRL
ncbi:MAG: 5'/3'-nucleotidase SurE [Pseudomonadota bacterium]|nr:5'/3'-nucleotidase SurE [Gammaproteobacteria bacterium]MBU1629267.1 5'/3'-nucleotidase SurE [Gammaproteobacteria bacterium]MBU1926523.1 5'/3'-nucleotidase SurE [Gammaproteobacteria bacterium]MBU2546022.1 5'/3'-nucleotidase SurE [Gammaproteobacteria bacterium]